MSRGIAALLVAGGVLAGFAAESDRGRAWAAPPEVGGGGRAAVLVYANRSAMQRRAGPVLPPMQVAQQLRQALGQRGFSVLSGVIEQALRARAEHQLGGPRRSLAEAQGRLAEGRRLLTHVELERAEAMLARAEDPARAALLLPEAPGVYAELLRWRGVVLVELHRQAEATRLFRRALALRPDAWLTEAEVRPDVVAHFRRAAQGLGERVPLRVVPRLAPAGAAATVPRAVLATITVTVDGMEVPLALPPGPAGHAGPATGAGAEIAVLPGEHVVVVRAPGYVQSGAVVNVDQGGSVHEVRLAPDPMEAELLGLRRDPAAVGLGALCAALEGEGLADVVAAVVGRDAGRPVLVGQRFHCATRQASALRLVRVSEIPEKGPSLRPVDGGPDGTLQAAAGQLVAQLWQSGFLPAGTQIDFFAHPALVQPRPPPPPRTPIYARPWLWVGAVALSSAAILGAALWPRPEPKTTVVVDPGVFALHVP